MEGTPSSTTSGQIRTSGSSSNKLTKLSDFLECCICRLELQDAHICGQCSQPFCRKCIVEWLAKEQSCPHCRHALTERAIVKVRTFAQLGAVVSELLADEQNRCLFHGREQLFFCFLCEQCLCDRCMFEKVHLEHRDRVVLLDEAFNHFNKHTSADFEWINDRALALKKHQDHIQKNKQLLKLEFERVDALIRHASESVSSQYKQKLAMQEKILKNAEQRSSTMSAVLQKAAKFDLKEKTAPALEQLIAFKREVKSIRSKSSPTDETEASVSTIDLSFENDVIPSPDKITFHLNNFKATMKKNKYCEALTNGKHGSVWRLKVSRVNSCTMTSLLLEQGNPGAYWAACYENPAKLYQFDLNKFVVMSVDKTNPIKDYSPEEDAVAVVIGITRTYAEVCQQQQDHIDRLEKKLARYEEFIAGIQEKTRSLQLEDENES